MHLYVLCFYLLKSNGYKSSEFIGFLCECKNTVYVCSIPGGWLGGGGDGEVSGGGRLGVDVSFLCSYPIMKCSQC